MFHGQSYFLSWLFLIVPLIFLVPPNPLDTTHCSFLNVTNTAAFSVVNVTAERMTMSPDFVLHQFLCIHVDGTGIYSINGEVTRKPLAAILLSPSGREDSYKRTKGIAIATKWLFILLMASSSAWWVLSQISSGISVVRWGLWALSMIEAITIVICVVIARNEAQSFSFVVGTSAVLYGSLFYASILILSILLGFLIWDITRSEPPRFLAIPYKRYEQRGSSKRSVLSTAKEHVVILWLVLGSLLRTVRSSGSR
ncbi:Receptor-type tyrosine-protein phosphatase beta [Fusarium oxysporum f. sp. albedinis]|nr:Receptor-type tyrosine-protein phosphatase beta [Fusarium oxysporum f. sp. albedinis]